MITAIHTKRLCNNPRRGMTDARGLHKVFVYGTLKKGQPNEYVMNGLPCGIYLGGATTVKKYPLVIGLPWNLPQMLNLESKGEHVHGELYEVDDAGLERLDEFEEVPELYHRVQVDVNMKQHTEASQEISTPVKCWVYFFSNYTASDLERKFIANYDGTGDTDLAYDIRENREHPNNRQ